MRCVYGEKDKAGTKKFSFSFSVTIKDRAEWTARVEEEMRSGKHGARYRGL